MGAGGVCYEQVHCDCSSDRRTGTYFIGHIQDVCKAIVHQEIGIKCNIYIADV